MSNMLKWHGKQTPHALRSDEEHKEPLYRDVTQKHKMDALQGDARVESVEPSILDQI